MNQSTRHAWTALGLFLALPLSAAMSSDDGAATYRLRYQFEPGQTLRWEVIHRSRVETTVSGTEKTAETHTRSVKVWRIRDVNKDGATTFEHCVEDVDMRHQFSGRPEVHYDSRKDEKPPAGFEHVAASIDKPLAVVTINNRGEILKRQRKPVAAAAENEGLMTIPLPEQPIGVGHRWTLPQEIEVPLENGAIKRVKSLQVFQLEDVKTGVATIRVATQILTPVDDPAVEARLIQRESNGTVRFDVDAGQILSQQMDCDKHVVGFRGPASSLHYVMRFRENVLTSATRTAAKPAAAAQ